MALSCVFNEVEVIFAALDILYAVDFDQNVTVIFADRDGFNRFKAVEMQLSRSQNRVIVIIPYGVKNRAGIIHGFGELHRNTV